jgi:hypothetical protein
MGILLFREQPLSLNPIRQITLSIDTVVQNTSLSIGWSTSLVKHLTSMEFVEVEYKYVSTHGILEAIVPFCSKILIFTALITLVTSL